MRGEFRAPGGHRAAAVIVLGLLASVAAGAVLAAAPADAATGTYLRLARLAPGAAAAHVTLTSVSDPARQYRVPPMRYGEFSEYRLVEPGIYTVSVWFADSPPNSPPVLNTTVDAAVGGSYTLVGIDAPGPTLRVLTDDLTPPPAGQTRTRMIAGDPAGRPLDIAVEGGPPLGTGMRLGEPAPYVSLPSGALDLRVTSGDRTETLPVDLPEGAVATVLVTERDGRWEPVVGVDARGPVAVPHGGVETGYGAAGPSAVAWSVVGVGLLGGVLARGALRRRVR